MQNNNLDKKVLDDAKILNIEKLENEREENFSNLDIEEGVIEISEDGFGFLRFDNFQTSERDVYVSKTLIKSFNIKTGDKVKGYINPIRENEKFRSLAYLLTINSKLPEFSRNRKKFDELTPIYPTKKIILENKNKEISNRVIDLVSPIGRGQRGLIVAPPKVGKTTLLKNIAKSIKENYDDIELIILLIDERPEEVTDIKNFISDVDVIYSTFDEELKNHIKMAEIVLSRAKALVEMGQDVVILLDSITRLARAYNINTPTSGKTLSGGLDPYALHYPKKFFGAARNTKEAGSLTIIATALIDTGSKMDDVIFEEFKGTGNMELVLSKELAQKRIFPTIDIDYSSTRKEELLLSKDELSVMEELRYRSLDKNDKNFNKEEFIKYIKNTKTNKEFVKSIKKIFEN